MEDSGSPFIVVHKKLKRVKQALTERNNKTFGNVFQKIVTLEDLIKAKEVLQLEISPTKENKMSLRKLKLI